LNAQLAKVNQLGYTLFQVSSSKEQDSTQQGDKMNDMYVSYTVKLNNGKISYEADYSCKECGWVDNDRSFFYEKNNELYCSLHKEG
jgi:hypothetical protein